jgi:hypothetical protein
MKEGEKGEGEERKHRVNFNGLEVNVILAGNKNPSSRAPYDVKILNPATHEEIIEGLTEQDRIALKTGAQHVILDTVTYRITTDIAYNNQAKGEVVRKIKYQRTSCSCC